MNLNLHDQAMYMWSCGLMDKALVFGTKDCRLESCQDQHIWGALTADVPQFLQTECLVPRSSRYHHTQKGLGNARGCFGWVGNKCNTDGAFSPWRSCGLMDKALVFGTKDCRLESCQDQKTCATLAAGNGPMFALCGAPVA